MNNELYHFNKNHDPKTGRFTFSRGGSNGSIYRKKSPKLFSGNTTIDNSRNNNSQNNNSGTSDLSDDELSTRVRRMNLEKQYDKLSKERRPKTGLEVAKQSTDETKSAVNKIQNYRNEKKRQQAQEHKRPDLSSMTDDELRKKINRERLEREYDNLFHDDNVSRGRDRVDEILDIAGPVLSVGSSALAIAIAIQTLKRGG